MADIQPAPPCPHSLIEQVEAEHTYRCMTCGADCLDIVKEMFAADDPNEDAYRDLAEMGQ